MNAVRCRCDGLMLQELEVFPFCGTAIFDAVAVPDFRGFGRFRTIGLVPSAILLSALNSDLPVARQRAWKREFGSASSLAGASCSGECDERQPVDAEVANMDAHIRRCGQRPSRGRDRSR